MNTNSDQIGSDLFVYFYFIVINSIKKKKKNLFIIPT